jgi:opacity protein-like surface antigen
MALVGRDPRLPESTAAETKVDVRGSMKWLGMSLLCLMVVGFARPAAAQPKAEISAGYNYLQAKSSSDTDWTKFPKGWYADVAGNVTPMVSIVGQVTGNYKTFDNEDFKLKVHTFMVGVRGSSTGNVRGFGQVLVGGAKLSGEEIVGTDTGNETDLAFQVGGGVNIMGSGPVGARVGIDYLRVRGKDNGELLDGDSLNGFRFSVGVVFGIGK